MPDLKGAQTKMGRLAICALWLTLIMGLDGVYSQANKALVFSLRRPTGGETSLEEIRGEPATWVNNLVADKTLPLETPVSAELQYYDFRALSPAVALANMFIVDVASVESGRILAFDMAAESVKTHTKRISRREDNLIAVDWINTNIYWIDNDVQANHLAVSSYGTSREAILVTGLSSPVALAVAPAQRYVFWIETGARLAIQRSNLEGGDVTAVISSSMTRPVAMTVDYELQRILWVDDGRNMLESANIDGSQRKTEREWTGTYEAQYSYLDMYGDFVFLLRTDHYIDVVSRVNGSFIVTVEFQIFGETDVTTHGLAMYAPERQQPSSGLGTASCDGNNGGCDHICMATSDQAVTCLCGFGWMKQGATCSSNLDEDNFIVLIDWTTDQIYQMDITSGATRELAVDSPGQPFALLYHQNETTVYWFDIEGTTIRRASLDGAVQETVLTLSQDSVVNGMALDETTGRVYYTDSGAKAIEYFIGSSKTTVLNTGVGSKPSDLVLDVVQRVMYWTDTSSSARIEKANMENGSGRRTLVSVGLKWPVGLAIDFTDKLLYWCDGYTSRIERANLDGSSRTLLLQDSVTQSHFSSLTLDETFLYYTDRRRRYVQKMNRRSLNTERLGPAFFDVLLDIHLFKSTFPNRRDEVLTTTPRPIVTTTIRPTVPTTPRPPVSTTPRPIVTTTIRPTVPTSPRPPVSTTPRPTVPTTPRPTSSSTACRSGSRLMYVTLFVMTTLFAKLVYVYRNSDY